MLLTTATEGASPWHAGEQALQRQAGVAGRMEEVGRRVLRNHLIEQHRAFYPQLPFIVLGTVDGEGDAWATVRADTPGFLQSPDPYTLHVALGREEADPADAGIGGRQRYRHARDRVAHAAAQPAERNDQAYPAGRFRGRCWPSLWQLSEIYPAARFPLCR